MAGGQSPGHWAGHSAVIPLAHVRAVPVGQPPATPRWCGPVALVDLDLDLDLAFDLDLDLQFLLLFAWLAAVLCSAS
jgi:hypothetical protein